MTDMTVPAFLPFAELATLQSDRLYCFVLGPGEGEAIALRLPGSGWILIDSFSVKNQPATAWILERFPGDTVELLVWTHPHKDHCDGLDVLVDRFSPRKVLVPGYELPAFAEFLRRTRERKNLAGINKEYLLCRAALDGYERLEAYKEADGHIVDEVTTADGVVLETIDWRLQLFHPDAAARESLNLHMSSHSLTDFNLLSAVLRLRFGCNDIVLGADLEESGWKRILGANPDLKLARSLKVPHHGSAGAFSDWRVSGDTLRTWWLSPKNTSHLPELPALKQLLEVQSQLSLTALPAYLALPSQSPHVSFGRLQSRTGPDGAVPRSRKGQEKTDCLWAASFSLTGLESVYYGPGAYLVGPDSAEVLAG